MLVGLLSELLSESLSRESPVMSESVPTTKQEKVLEGPDFADTLGVITTALGFIADIIAYQELLEPTIDEPPTPPLPPSIQEESEEDDDYDNGEYDGTKIILFLNILVIVVVIALFIFTGLLAKDIKY